MSEVRTFFRFCPACGRRFHIRLVSKTLVAERETKTVVKESMAMGVSRGGFQMANPTMVEEDVPITIDIEDFQYSYKCKHCGHVWTEMHTEER